MKYKAEFTAYPLLIFSDPRPIVFSFLTSYYIFSGPDFYKLPHFLWNKDMCIIPVLLCLPRFVPYCHHHPIPLAHKQLGSFPNLAFLLPYLSFHMYNIILLLEDKSIQSDPYKIVKWNQSTFFPSVLFGVLLQAPGFQRHRHRGLRPPLSPSLPSAPPPPFSQTSFLLQNLFRIAHFHTKMASQQSLKRLYVVRVSLNMTLTWNQTKFLFKCKWVVFSNLYEVCNLFHLLKQKIITITEVTIMHAHVSQKALCIEFTLVIFILNVSGKAILKKHFSLVSCQIENGVFFL